jgi:hypothetical protein
MFSIARQWNGQGFVTPAGRPFDTQSVRSVLTCATVAGKMDPVESDPEVRDGSWDAILTWEQVEAIRQKLEDDEAGRMARANQENGYRNTRLGRGQPARYLLTGLVLCGVCGSRRVFRQGDFYRCTAGWHGHQLPDGTPRNHYSRLAVPMDDYVTGLVLAVIEQQAAAELLTDRGEDLEQLRAAVAEVELKLEGFFQDYSAGVIKGAEYSRLKGIWEPKLAEARAARNRALGPAVHPLHVFEGKDREGIERVWDGASVDERHDYVHALVHHFVVYPPGRGRPKGSGVGMGRGKGGYFRDPIATVRPHWREPFGSDLDDAQADGSGDLPGAGGHGGDPGCPACRRRDLPAAV